MMLIMGGLTKLCEELGELSEVVGKKLTYFDTDIHPDGKGSLKRRLEEEIADVIAASTFVMENLELDQEFIEQRVDMKLERFNGWATDPVARV